MLLGEEKNELNWKHYQTKPLPCNKSSLCRIHFKAIKQKLWKGGPEVHCVEKDKGYDLKEQKEKIYNTKT